MANKKMIAVCSLLEECEEKDSKELETEILSELSSFWIPWVKRVDSVKVVEQ